MGKRFLLFLILISWFFNASAQDFGLAAMLIPDTLLQNADAVIRFHHTEINRMSAGKAVMKVHLAVTVLNKNGRSDAWLALHYDKNRKVESIRGKFYNALGVEIDKVKKSDINDFSSYTDFTFYSDSRSKQLVPIRKQFPYTAEYEYEITLNGLVGFDVWMPVTHEGLAVEQADFTVIYNKEFPVSYKAENGAFDFMENDDGKTKTFRWAIGNIPAFKSEPFMPPKKDFLPWVMLAPHSFEYERTTGSFDTWQNYGAWVNGLLKNRDKIPRETHDKILKLIEGDIDTRTSIQKIYQYMQRNTRYVNISLGIGGFQPMAAEDVDANGYGDCKALSNYTKALLKVAGIESFYAEIGNGKERGSLFSEFPSVNQTNHVILCVPVENDTIWLECTSQQYPCGYIGASNVNRKAVLIGEDGGHLVSTSRGTEADNLTLCTANAVLSDDGNLSCDATFTYQGLSCATIFYPLNVSAQEQKKWLLKTLQPGQLTIRSYKFSDSLTEDFQNSLALAIDAAGYASAVGKRLMVKPNIFNKYTSAITHRPERRHDIFVGNGTTEIDSLQIVLPQTYLVEYMPEDLSDSCLMGSYTISFDTTQHVLTVVRELVIKGGTFSKDHYDEIYGFFKTIDKGDHQKAVLLRKD